MTDRDALLRAVIANPDEDTPRLAYADWLDEHTADAVDRDRATFIRDSIAVDRVGVPNLRCDRTGEELADPRFPDAVGAAPRPRCRCRTCAMLRRRGDATHRWLRKWTDEVTADVGATLRAAVRQHGLNAGTPRPTLHALTLNLWPRVGFRRGFGHRLSAHPTTLHLFGGLLFARAPFTAVEMEPAFALDGTGPFAAAPQVLGFAARLTGRRWDTVAEAMAEVNAVAMGYGQAERDALWAAERAA